MTEEKFREIYRQHYQIVKKVVYSILRDIDFAEDVSQEVFISFLKKADTLQEEYHKQWLIVNAKRKAIDFCRKSYQVHEVTAGASNEEELFAEEGIMWTSNRSEKQSSVEEETTKKLVMQEFTGKFFEDLEKKKKSVVRNCYENECRRSKCIRNCPCPWHFSRKSESQKAQDKSLD